MRCFSQEETFKLNQNQISRAADWITNVARPAALELQKSKTRNPTREVSSYWKEGYPFGEVVWYCFHIGYIGTNVKVVYEAGTYKNEFDLTEYHEW